MARAVAGAAVVFTGLDYARAFFRHAFVLCQNSGRAGGKAKGNEARESAAY